MISVVVKVLRWPRKCHDSSSLANAGGGLPDIATVCPVYQRDLTPREMWRVDTSLLNSRPNGFFFLVPESLDSGFLHRRWPAARILRIPDEYLATAEAYNTFVLMPDLYERLQEHAFVLICQLDAVLIKPLPLASTFAFDYAGAPWNPPFEIGISGSRLVPTASFFGRRLVVGNGGLSLRRTSAFKAKANRLSALPKANEDLTIAFWSPVLRLRLADARTAGQLFSEMETRAWRAGQPIPDVHGFHNLERFNPQLEHLLSGSQRPPRQDSP